MAQVPDRVIIVVGGGNCRSVKIKQVRYKEEWVKKLPRRIKDFNSK